MDLQHTMCIQGKYVLVFFGSLTSSFNAILANIYYSKNVAYCDQFNSILTSYFDYKFGKKQTYIVKSLGFSILVRQYRIF